MKKIKYKTNLIVIVFLLLLGTFSCQDLNPLPESDPTKIAEAPYLNVLTSVQILNLSVQKGDLAAFSSGFTRSLFGRRLEDPIEYLNLKSHNDVWGSLFQLLVNIDVIEEKKSADFLVLAIVKIIEADAIRAMSNLYGDIPYSQVGDPLTYFFPKLDSQLEVYNTSVTLLKEAIVALEGLLANGSGSANLTNDIYYQGNRSKWLEAANSLLARTYLEMKDYSNALLAAENGISTSLNNLQWVTTGLDPSELDDKNYLWGRYTRYAFVNTDDTYLEGLLETRENDKTKEAARIRYYTIPEERLESNDPRIGGGYAPMELITYHETLLIVAECAARANDLNKAVDYLNMLRNNLVTGEHIRGTIGGVISENVIPIINEGDERIYDAYELADFEPGGMENVDGIQTGRALLREIIEERYVSLFLSMMPFNDARRLRKSDGDLIVPFFDLDKDPPQMIERFPYPEISISNPNIPVQNGNPDPSIFEPTQINQ